MPSAITGLLDTVAATPQAVAVRDAERCVTYSELFWRAERLAGQLPARGAAPQPILLFLGKSVEAVASIAATLLAGHLYCPVLPDTPARRVQAILDNMRPAAILTMPQHAARLAQLQLHGATVIPLGAVEGAADQPLADQPVADQSGQQQEAARRKAESVSLTDPAYVIYTSGSTGDPKGVAVSHLTLLDHVSWMVSEYGLNSADVIANQVPLVFDMSVSDVFGAWASGATLLLIHQSQFAFPARVVQLLGEAGVTHIFWVPTALSSLTRLGTLQANPPGSLRNVLSAGEVLPAELAAQWRAALPAAVIANLYGPTETGVICSHHRLPDQEVPAGDLPIGRACPNTGLWILDEAGRPVPAGQPGELWVTGTGVALGYWNDPERSAAVFRPLPAVPQYPDRAYRTGDQVWRDEAGLLRYIGRLDFQIKHLGFRIELGEIEAHVRTAPFIAQACAVYDAQRRQIHLFVTSSSASPADSGSAAAAGIGPRQRREIARLLPRHMQPAEIHLRAELPLNTNGKVDRAALAAQLADL